MTPEELEEKRKKEQEWADKCVKAGERFADRIDLKGKAERLNDFVNTYPKTFLTIFLAVMAAGFVTNMLVAGIRNVFLDTAEDLKTATLEKDTAIMRFNREIEGLYKEYADLGEMLEKKLSQVVLSHDDSLEVLKISRRMEELQSLLNAGMSGETAFDSQKTEEIYHLEQELERMESKEGKTAEDTAYIRSLLEKINMKSDE